MIPYDRGADRLPNPKIRFAFDSPLEGDGSEPSVPREKDDEKSIAVLPLSRSRYPWVGWAQNKGAGAIQSSARLLGQSIGAAMVALVSASAWAVVAPVPRCARGLLRRGARRNPILT
jgi:hypothetical protein